MRESPLTCILFPLQVATSSLESSLLKYSAKEYMFRAALCHLCVDLTDARIAVEKYEEMYPAFQDSRECKLLKVGNSGSCHYICQSVSEVVTVQSVTSQLMMGLGQKVPLCNVYD